MRFKVYLLRNQGRRLPWRDVRNGPFFVGSLVTHREDRGGERYAVTSVRPSDPMQADTMPKLYEAVLLGFSPLAFRLRGFERTEDGYGVIQEWHIEEAALVGVSRSEED